MPADFYDLLEVDRDADTSAIKRAYREKARSYHPDVNEDPRARDQFATLNRARETLTDPKERSRYDRLGHTDYVNQHLDGLPTLSRPNDAKAGDGETEDGATADEAGTARDEGTARDQETVGGDTRSRTVWDSGDRTRTEGSTGAASTGATSTGATSAGETATDEAPSGASSRSAASSGRSARESRTSSRTETERTGTNASASARNTDRAGTATGRRERSTTERSGHAARKRGLRRGWALSAAALLIYAVGLAAAVAITPDATSATLDALLADPASALLGESPLPDPASTVGAAAVLASGTITPAALVGAALGVGLLALPAAIGGTVARFGSGAATLYAVAVAVPVVWVLVRPFVPAPLAADLLALAVAPLVAGVWFLADIGRYLRS